MDCEALQPGVKISHSSNEQVSSSVKVRSLKFEWTFRTFSIELGLTTRARMPRILRPLGRFSASMEPAGGFRLERGSPFDECTDSSPGPCRANLPCVRAIVSYRVLRQKLLVQVAVRGTGVPPVGSGEGSI